MSTLSAIVNNVTYSLDDGTYCYWTGDDGLGMAPLHRLSERGPLQHGITDRGYRLDPRTIRLILDIKASTQADWESKRTSLLNIFKPSDTAMSLELAFSAATYRLDCYYISQMTMPSADRLGWNQTVVIELLAPDPTWYDPTKRFHYFTLSGGTDVMEVPIVVPLGVGSTTINENTSITNTGQVETYPVIRILGPITGPKIVNNTTGDELDFAGTTIADGNWYQIDCRYGYKTVEDQDGVNKIADLSDASDLATFRFDANPEAAGGINSLRVTGLSANSSSMVVLEYYIRYLGV